MSKRTSKTSEYKRCSKGDNCIHPDGPYLPRTSEYYHKNAHTSDGFQHYCRACHLASARRYREKYPERARESNRRWRNANLEHARQIQKRTYRKIRDSRLAYYSKWRRQNPDRMRSYTSARKAKILSQAGAHTADDIKKQYQSQRGRCYYCGERVGTAYHVDHVIPLSRGGSNGPENIVIACPACNLSKNDKMPHEWTGTDRLL